MTPNGNPQPTPELPRLFRSAARLIQAQGHHKGSFFDPTSALPRSRRAMCAVGALRSASTGDPAFDNSRSRAAAEFLSARIYSPTVCSDPVERVAEWNDRPERTAGEVVSELLTAAEAAEAAPAQAVAA